MALVIGSKAHSRQLLTIDWRLREVILPWVVKKAHDAGYDTYVTSVLRVPQVDEA